MKSINALKMIFSVPNCMIYVWFLFMDIRLTSFSSQYQTWLRWVTVGVDGNITAEAEETISQWTDTLNIVNLFNILLLSMVRHKPYYANTKSKQVAQLVFSILSY